MSASNKIADLSSQGQSVWLDYIRRNFIESGELAKLVADGLGGVTSNPAIFEKAIAGSDDYAAAIDEIAKNASLSPKRVFELLAIRDIQEAADILRPVYERTKAFDGYVSLEVAPDLASNTEATLEEARRLWGEVDRPNLMIKVPATPEGILAFRTLISEGINVNVTLLFARSAYEAVARAYIEGLEGRLAVGKPIQNVASVASFFVSRIDASVDAKLGEKIKANPGDAPKLEPLLGKVAIANAKLAYQSYKKLFGNGSWSLLAKAGAKPQRVLWASTGTKNPNYRDVLYVEELIGANTVNTVPPETLTAFREHGKVAATLEAGVGDAQNVLDGLEAAGISLNQVTDDLLVDGLKKFVEPFHKLMTTVNRRYSEARERGHLATR